MYSQLLFPSQQTAWLFTGVFRSIKGFGLAGEISQAGKRTRSLRKLNVPALGHARDPHRPGPPFLGSEVNDTKSIQGEKGGEGSRWPQVQGKAQGYHGQSVWHLAEHPSLYHLCSFFSSSFPHLFGLSQLSQLSCPPLHANRGQQRAAAE